MADRTNFYLGQLVTEADLDGIQENLQSADHALIRDQVYYGVVQNLGVSEHAGVPDLTVDVAGPGIAYDQEGKRIYVPSTITVDCSVDSNGSSTAVVGGGNEKYVSVFLLYDEVLSNLQQDDNGTPVFVDITESYQVQVVQGSEAPAGTATRPSLLADGLLLADVLLAFGTTQIFDADIDSDDEASSTTRFAWAFNLTATSPAQVRARTLPEFAQDTLTELNDHTNNLSNAHPLDAISFDVSNVPARFTNTAGSSETQEAVDALMTEMPQDYYKAVLDVMTPGAAYDLGRSGVITGLTGRGAGTLVVTIEAGCALKYEGGHQANMWRLTSDTTIDFTGDPDGANPRWAVVELNTTDGTFTRVLGTPAATPTFPAGSADRIPLFYVYIPAAAASLVSTDIVQCQPMLHPQPVGEVEFIYGAGGVQVDSAGSTITLGQLRATWSGGSRFGCDFGDTFDLSSTTDVWESGESYGALATDQILYVYGFRPEYPAGYDTDVAAVERVIQHTGTRIPGVFNNMLLVVSQSSAPGSGVEGSPGSITTNSSLWPALTRGVYLGSCHFLTVVGDLGTQTRVSDVVTLTTGYSTRHDNTTTPGSGTIDLHFADQFAGGGARLYPANASDLLIGAQFLADPTSTSRAFLRDDRNSEILFDCNRGNVAAIEDYAAQFWIHGESSFFYSLTESGGVNNLIVWVNSYRDGILALRR